MSPDNWSTLHSNHHQSAITGITMDAEFARFPGGKSRARCLFQLLHFYLGQASEYELGWG